jgi:hypothetical protein
MATAGPVQFEIPCYSSWSVTMTWYTDSTKTATVDLSNYSAALLALATGGSGIVLGGTGGTITVSLTDVQTASVTPGFAVWDLELIDSGGSNLRLVEGTAEFTPSVTRN